MRLWRVTVSTTVFVLAESRKEAVEDALDASPGENPDVTEARPVTDVQDVPTAWRDAIPYGDNDAETTCAGFLASLDKEAT